MNNQLFKLTEFLTQKYHKILICSFIKLRRNHLITKIHSQDKEILINKTLKSKMIKEYDLNNKVFEYSFNQLKDVKIKASVLTLHKIIRSKILNSFRKVKNTSCLGDTNESLFDKENQMIYENSYNHQHTIDSNNESQYNRIILERKLTDLSNIATSPFNKIIQVNHNQMHSLKSLNFKQQDHSEIEFEYENREFKMKNRKLKSIKEEISKHREQRYLQRKQSNNMIGFRLIMDLVKKMDNKRLIQTFDIIKQALRLKNLKNSMLSHSLSNSRIKVLLMVFNRMRSNSNCDSMDKLQNIKLTLDKILIKSLDIQKQKQINNIKYDHQSKVKRLQIIDRMFCSYVKHHKKYCFDKIIITNTSKILKNKKILRIIPIYNRERIRMGFNQIKHIGLLKPLIHNSNCIRFERILSKIFNNNKKSILSRLNANLSIVKLKQCNLFVSINTILNMINKRMKKEAFECLHLPYKNKIQKQKNDFQTRLAQLKDEILLNQNVKDDLAIKNVDNGLKILNGIVKSKQRNRSTRVIHRLKDKFVQINPQMSIKLATSQLSLIFLKHKRISFEYFRHLEIVIETSSIWDEFSEKEDDVNTQQMKVDNKYEKFHNLYDQLKSFQQHSIIEQKRLLIMNSGLVDLAVTDSSKIIQFEFFRRLRLLTQQRKKLLMEADNRIKVKYWKFFRDKFVYVQKFQNMNNIEFILQERKRESQKESIVKIRSYSNRLECKFLSQLLLNSKLNEKKMIVTTNKIRVMKSKSIQKSQSISKLKLCFSIFKRNLQHKKRIAQNIEHKIQLKNQTLVKSLFKVLKQTNTNTKESIFNDNLNVLVNSKNCKELKRLKSNLHLDKAIQLLKIIFESKKSILFLKLKLSGHYQKPKNNIILQNKALFILDRIFVDEKQRSFSMIHKKSKCTLNSRLIDKFERRIIKNRLRKYFYGLILCSQMQKNKISVGINPKLYQQLLIVKTRHKSEIEIDDPKKIDFKPINTQNKIDKGIKLSLSNQYWLNKSFKGLTKLNQRNRLIKKLSSVKNQYFNCWKYCLGQEREFKLVDEISQINKERKKTNKYLNMMVNQKSNLINDNKKILRMSLKSGLIWLEMKLFRKRKDHLQVLFSKIKDFTSNSLIFEGRVALKNISKKIRRLEHNKMKSNDEKLDLISKTGDSFNKLSNIQK